MISKKRALSPDEVPPGEQDMLDHIMLARNPDG